MATLRHGVRGGVSRDEAATRAGLKGSARVGCTAETAREDGPVRNGSGASKGKQTTNACPRATWGQIRDMETLRFARIAVVLHWGMALLIVANVALALSADLLPDDRVRPVIDTHRSIGITVLGLVLLRILWRAAHRPPALPTAYAAWERAASQAAHGVLNGLMLALPLSGWLHDSAWKDAAT
jgi:hypothetical protein